MIKLKETVGSKVNNATGGLINKQTPSAITNNILTLFLDQELGNVSELRDQLLRQDMFILLR